MFGEMVFCFARQWFAITKVYGIFELQGFLEYYHLGCEPGLDKSF
jgi:hypothetical protein